MCGPLSLGFAPSRSALLLYQSGRLVAYTAIGAIAGALGNTFFGGLLGGPAAGISIIILAILLFAIGYRTFRGRNDRHLAFPSAVSNLSSRALRKLRNSRFSSFLPPVAGALTVLLPCAHLYGFVLGASATGSALRGGIFMFLFGLSTVPALVFAPMVIRAATTRWNSLKSPRAAGIILILAGLTSLASFAIQVGETRPTTHRASQNDGSDKTGHSCH